MKKNKKKEKTKCEHKNIELFDGIQEGYHTRFYFCRDCGKQLEVEFYDDYKT